MCFDFPRDLGDLNEVCPHNRIFLIIIYLFIYLFYLCSFLLLLLFCSRRVFKLQRSLWREIVSTIKDKRMKTIDLIFLISQEDK